MTHRIQAVKPLNNCILSAVFYNGEVVNYDVKKLFAQLPVFKELEDNEELFDKVQVDQGGYGIFWNDNLDLDAETIWEGGILVESQKEPSYNHLLAYKLLLAREHANITQKELAERTGIYQADISKLERGMGNPSLSTLKRLADGLGMELQIDFICK